MIVVENLLRKAYGETPNYWKDICCRYTFQCAPTTYITENKETMFKFTLKHSIMSIVFSSFKHLKLPISIIIPQIVYIWMTAISTNLIS